MHTELRTLVRDRCAAALPLRALDRFTGFEREQILQSELEVFSGDGGDRLICVRCNTPITSTLARSEPLGAHIHAFSNPMGVRYVIACFDRAETVQRGAATEEHTWFPGYAWQVAHCPECQVHLGWRFVGPDHAEFFGLICDRLCEEMHPEG